MKEVTYLGYKFRWNGGQEAQVKENIKKALGVMEQVGNREKEVWW